MVNSDFNILDICSRELYVKIDGIQNLDQEMWSKIALKINNLFTSDQGKVSDIQSNSFIQSDRNVCSLITRA